MAVPPQPDGTPVCASAPPASEGDTARAKEPPSRGNRQEVDHHLLVARQYVLLRRLTAAPQTELRPVSLGSWWMAAAGAAEPLKKLGAIELLTYPQQFHATQFILNGSGIDSSKSLQEFIVRQIGQFRQLGFSVCAIYLFESSQQFRF
ncbi:hypothetical protein LTS15_005337 [Exophiala xenobiotica]|nr:hypothetical protein LTS15_005337 [Exophiala xenobiotica]